MSGSAHLDDAHLSAMLDGGADRATREHAASCADCTDRLARWEGVRSMVAAPVAPPDPARVDAAIEAALARGGPPADPPVALDAARARRSQRLGRTVAGVAAAVLIGLVAFAVARNHPGQSAKSTAGPAILGTVGSSTTATRHPSTFSPTQRGSAAPSASKAALNVPSGARPAPDLGSFDGPAPLAARLRVTPGTNLSQALASETHLPACEIHPESEPAPRSVAVLTYRGRAAVVYVEGDRAAVYDLGSCTPAATFNF